jgi:hypothetical protein
MLNFNSLKFFGVVAALFTAACGTEPRSAGAQDLSVLFHKPATAHAQGTPQVLTRPNRSFSVDDPARILVIGDSLSEGFAMFLDRRVKERKLAAVVINRGRNSSGLARSDFYDWPANFASIAPAERPDIVIAHFGSNDNQSIIRPGGTVRHGSEGWNGAYREQTRKILETAARNDTMFYLIGPAPDRGTNLNRHLTNVNPIFKEEAEAFSARYFPLSPFAAGPGGEYAKVVQVNGVPTTIRSGDGSHFTGTGYFLVADKLLEDISTVVPSIFNTKKLELAGVLQ